MPFSKINTTFTPAQLAAIDAAIAEILANLPAQFNLNKDERTALPNISDERYPYAKRGIQIHGPNNPNLVSGFAGTQAEATNDLTFFDQSETVIQRLRQVIEIVTDTQQVAGSEAYAWLRELYRMAQGAAANQVPGSDAVVDDLKTLFEGQGTAGEEPNP
jgi:hypothetical protein